MKHQLKPNTYTDPQIHKAVEGKTVTLSDAVWDKILYGLDNINYHKVVALIKEQLNNQ